jgi:beta-glucanase (GH16 family)
MVRTAGYFLVLFAILAGLTAFASLTFFSCIPTTEMIVNVFIPDPLDYADNSGDNWTNPTAFTTLAWSDEFNATNLNTGDWNYITGASGYGNNEWENYTTANNVFTNGNLVIKARKNFNGFGGYTSTRITTQNKQHFFYGTIAARIKLPYSKGVWPAFWMMGTNGLSWPRCGEIDIMEMIGGDGATSNNNKTTTGNIFWYDSGTGNAPGSMISTNYADLKDNFHVFAVERTQSQIKWYFDHSNYMTRAMGANQDELTNQHFYILLNLAIGGNWPGYPAGTETYPQRMFVDWVRVYTN